MCFLVCLYIHMVSAVTLSMWMSVIVCRLVPKVACTRDIAFHFHFLYVLISCVPSVWPPYCLCHPMQMCVYMGPLYVCAHSPPKGGGLELLPLTFSLGLTFMMWCDVVETHVTATNFV